MCHLQLQVWSTIPGRLKVSLFKCPLSGLSTFFFFLPQGFSKASVSQCVHTHSWKYAPEGIFKPKRDSGLWINGPPHLAILQRFILQGSSEGPQQDWAPLAHNVTGWILAFLPSLLHFAFLFWLSRVIPQRSHCTPVFDSVFAFGEPKPRQSYSFPMVKEEQDQLKRQAEVLASAGPAGEEWTRWKWICHTQARKEWRGAPPLYPRPVRIRVPSFSIPNYTSLFLFVAVRRLPKDRDQSDCFTVTLFLIKHNVTQWPGIAICALSSLPKLGLSGGPTSPRFQKKDVSLGEELGRDIGVCP